MVSLEDNITWLALCSAQIKQQNIPIDQGLAEVFVNKKLLSMLNSLAYEEVF